MIKDIKIRGKLPFIVLETMGGKELRMLIDTGAQNSVVADARNLKGIHSGGKSIGQSGVEINILEGSIEFVLKDDYNIGSKEHILLEKVKCFSLKTISRAVGFRIDGIFGSDLLIKYNAVVNFNENYVTLNY